MSGQPSTGRPPEAAGEPDAFGVWHALLADGRAFYLADRAGRVLHASAAFAVLFAAERAPGDDPWLLPARFRAVLRRLAELPYEAAETIEMDGEKRRVTHLPVFAGEGELVGIAGVLGDAAPNAAGEGARVAALEAALDEAERRVAELEAALAASREEIRGRARLLGTVSHELRTPLNAIIGFSELALRETHGALPAAYRGYFADVASAGRHAAELVESVLDRARLEAGGLRLERREVAARALVQEALALVAPRAQQRGIDIAGVALRAEFLLEVDPLRARQIVVNLLANAVKFTPRGGAVGIAAERAGGGLVALTVWDTGPGIPEAEHERIFEPFYQRSGAEIGDGAGLGLAIARDLARAMGGDLVVESASGGGARFTALLPLAATEAQAASA